MDVYENAALVAAVLGLTEVCKQVGMPSRFAPLAALVFGIILAFLAGIAQGMHDYPTLALEGVVTGLAASGLWSGPRNLVGSGTVQPTQ